MQVISIQPGFESWRTEARRLLKLGIAPQSIVWDDGSLGQSQLFSATAEAGTIAPAFAVSKRFLDVAATVALHRDPGRWALLYTILFRLTRENRHLLDIEVDADVCKLFSMEQSVRRDMHKMKAFVRFRKVEEGGEETYVAWHKPDHFIVEAMAPWFADRFGSMRWSILTPDRSAHWNLNKLQFTPGVRRSQAPAGDELEDLWRSYYASIFNPARLKVNAMKKEMAVRYWPALPEAQLIPHLINSAGTREVEMRQTQPQSAASFIPATLDLPMLAEAVQGCKGCDLYRHATQAVFGEGPERAAVMFIGEQPGDQEDRKGRPFVGPAGQLFDQAMQEAGVDRASVYVTNAVKHFKFEERGKRRIHSKPTGVEVAACLPWLEAEIAAVRPRLIVCLGATAASAVVGKTFRITRDRGQFFPHRWAEAVVATVHPSFLLRVPEPERQKEEYSHFVADLRLVADRMRDFAPVSRSA